MRDQAATDSLRRLVLLAIASLGLVHTLQAAPVSEFIFTSAPFRSAHASNLVELSNGDLLAAWFGGSAEGRPDVAIWASRRSDGRWSPPFELVREHEVACYNPVLFHTKDGRLWFYYKFGPNPEVWSAGRRWSDDEGRTWSPAEHLPAGLYGPIRTKPFLLDDGTVISGTSVESYRSWASWIERSTDNGVTWRRIGPITVPRDRSLQNADASTYGIIQPSVISLAGGRLRLYARSTSQIGRICIADSTDAGLSWTDARPIAIPNPNSGIDVVQLTDRRIVLVYNHSSTARTPLNLAVSTDGENFRMFKVLEDKPGEYSYPAMIQDRHGDLDITYTWKRQRIRYVRVPLSEIP